MPVPAHYPTCWKIMVCVSGGGAAGRGSLREQKKPKQEKCSKKPQNPHRPLHALLAGFLCKTCRLKTRTTTNTPNFYTQLIFSNGKKTELAKTLNNQKRQPGKTLATKTDFAEQNRRQTKTTILEDLTWPKIDKANETEIILQTKFTKIIAKKRQAILKTYKASHEQNRSHEIKSIKTTARRNKSEKPWSRFWRLDKTTWAFANEEI